jgi:hypothetical protein
MITENEREFFEERAGIIEYDGQFDRFESENMAAEQTLRYFKKMQTYVEKKPRSIEAVQWFNHGDHPMVREFEGVPTDVAPMGYFATKKGVRIVKSGDFIVHKGPVEPIVYSKAYFDYKYIPLEGKNNTVEAYPTPIQATSDYWNKI